MTSHPKQTQAPAEFSTFIKKNAQPEEMKTPGLTSHWFYTKVLISQRSSCSSGDSTRTELADTVQRQNIEYSAFHSYPFHLDLLHGQVFSLLLHNNENDLKNMKKRRRLHIVCDNYPSLEFDQRVAD